MRILLLMLFAHVLGDFILTTEAQSRYKDRGVKRESDVPGWWYWLTAHAYLHGGLIYFATGTWYIALYVFIIHWLIDHAKCEDKINANQDQVLHIVCILFAWMVEII